MSNHTMKTLGFALALTLLASCASNDETTSQGTNNAETSGQTSTTGEVTKLTLWHYYTGSTNDALLSIVNEFNDTIGAEENIEVEATSYNGVSDLAKALISSANKEVGMPEMPAIFAAYNDTALVLDEMGVVANMDPYFSAQELAMFQEDFLNEGRFDQEGQLKSIPVAKSTEQLFINETDFAVFAEATGVSMDQMETWEGMAELAKTYYQWTDSQTPDIEWDGKALFGVDSEANFVLVAAKQLGEEVYHYGEDTVSFGLSKEAAKKIWDNLLVPYHQGYYTSFGSYRADDVKSGDLLLYSGSTSSTLYFPSTVELGRADAYEIQGTARAYPYFQGGERVTVQQGAGMVVSKSTETMEDAAATFLKWFTSAQVNLDFAVSTGYIPVQNDALSFDGVFEVMSENYGEDIPKIVLDSATVTYQEMLVDYEFYASRTFNGSYDTRNAISDAIIDTIAQGQETLEALLAQEITRETALEEICSTESFDLWYDTLKTNVETILASQ